MCHDRSGTDCGIVAYRHPRHNDDITADPYVVAHVDGQSVFYLPVPLFYIKRMTGSVERTIGCNKDIITEGHLGLIKNHAVGVGKEVLAHLYIIAIVAEERTNDKHPLTCLAEQLPQSFHTLLPA